MRLRFGVLVIAFFSFAAVAQTATTEPNRPQTASHGFNGTARQLALSDQQKSEVQALLKAEREQRESIRNNTSLTPEQKRDQLRQLRHSSHDRVLAVLTPEQQQRLQQRHEPVSGIGPLALLNMTPDQKSRIAPILAADRQQTKAVLGDSSLTPEQKRAKLQEIRQSTNSQIGTVLSPTQRQRLQQFKEHRSSPTTTQPSGLR